MEWLRSRTLWARTGMLCGGLIALAGAVAILGWAANLRLNLNIIQDYKPMSPTAGLAFLLVGLALLALAGWPDQPVSRRWALAAASLAFGLGLLTALGSILDIPIGLDSIFLKSAQAAGTPQAGLMSPVTAILFLLSSLGLLGLWRGYHRAPAILGLLVFACGIIFGLGYLYNAPLLYGGPLLPVSLPTSLALAIFGTGLIFTAGDQVWPLNRFSGPSTRARMLRSLMPVISLVVILANWLSIRLLGKASDATVLAAALLAMATLTISALLIRYISGSVAQSIDQAEAARQQSERRFRQAFENSPTQMWEEDFSAVKLELDRLKAAGVSNFRAYLQANLDALRSLIDKIRVTDVNQAALKLYKASSKQEMMAAIQQILTSRADPTMIEEFANIAAGLKRFEIIGDPVNIGGESRSLILHWGVVGDDETLGQVILSVIDISDLRQAELALRKSEQRYRSLFDNNPAPLWEEDFSAVKQELDRLKTTGVTDFRAYLKANPEVLHVLIGKIRVTDVNQAALKLHHASCKQDLLTNFKPLMNNVALSTMTEEFARIAEGSKVFELIEDDGVLENVTRSLILHWGVVGDEEALDRVILSVTDITGLRQVEQALRRSEQSYRKLNDELERRVIQRTAQLEVANRELEAFSYSISHDLRAPLRHIAGYAQILKEDYASPLGGGGSEILDRVLAGAYQMNELMDALLTLSRVNRAELRMEVVSLSAMAEEVAADLKHSEPQRMVEFCITPGLLAQGDSRLLRLVVENLLNNAWKFTAKKPQARIEFSCTAQEDGTRAYFVSDNGAGFNMEYAGKLFGAFQRLHNQEDFKGSGIGLATVQRIIRRHGGVVWAEGEVNAFAKFYFTLP